MTARCNKFVLTLVVSFLSIKGISQNNVRLLSSTGIFNIYIADKPANKTPQAEVLIENIETDTLYLKIEFEGEARQGISLYLLDKGRPASGKEFCYLVTRDKKKVDIDFRGVYEIIPARKPIVPVKPVNDTSTSYRNATLGHLCEMKDGKPVYFNNIPLDGRCTEPMPPAYLNHIALLMGKAQVPDEKFLIAESVCRNNCVSVGQLSALLNYVDYELDKLKLIRIAYQHVTDKQDRALLEKNFRFESSVLELRRIFKERDQHPDITGAACTAPSPEKEMSGFIERLTACTNDSQRFNELRKSYYHLCFNVKQVKSALGQFIHDREKLDAARLLYEQCVEKDKYMEVADVFSYNQSVSELNDFIQKRR
jgi:hypothetical protein